MFGTLILNGILFVSDGAHQKHAYSVRHGQPHRGQRFGGLLLDLLVHTDVNHCGGSHFGLLSR
jgi:hypothetical protein